MKIKIFLLSFFLALFGVAGSTSAFNIQVEQNQGVFDPWSSFSFDPNRLTSESSRTCLSYECSNPYRSFQSFDGYNYHKQFYNNNFIYSYYFNFWTGDYSFVIPNQFVALTNFIGSVLPWQSRDYPNSFPSYASNLINTIWRDDKMVLHDRDSVRVFTTWEIYTWWSYLQTLPKYSSLWWLTYDTLNIYLPDSQYPAYTFDLWWNESVRRWPDYTYSTINCTNKWDNYCTAPTFTTTTTNTLTQDKLKQATDVKNFSFQWVSYIKRGQRIDNATRPYTFLGVLSWNKVEFNVFSCYNWNLETQDWCTEVLHGLTQEIFGVNYPKMYWSPCSSSLSTDTWALLWQALFWNNSIYQCWSSTSLWNYFSRIDFDNHKLYVASADIPWYAEQNAIGFEVLDEYNIAQNYTWRTTSWYKQEEVNNVMASCSWHYNDPAYPWCFIVQVSSWVDPYSLSPLLPSPEKTLLQEALVNSWKRAEVFEDCQNLDYFLAHQMVCDNVAVRVEGSTTWSWFSINSEKLKTFSCQSEFYASSTEDFNLTLGTIPLVWDIFDKLNIWDYSLTRPFACIEWAINYARNNGLDSSVTLTWSSLVTLSDTAKTKWDWFFNLLLIVPALYFIKKSWAIF